MRRRLLLGTLGIFLLAGSGPAVGGTTLNTIDPTATLGKKGRQVEVTVLLGCDIDQDAILRITITQRSVSERRGVVAERKKKVHCTTQVKRFEMKARIRGTDRFKPGVATAGALAITKDDVRQWCKDLTLVED